MIWLRIQYMMHATSQSTLRGKNHGGNNQKECRYIVFVMNHCSLSDMRVYIIPAGLKTSQTSTCIGLQKVQYCAALHQYLTIERRYTSPLLASTHGNEILLDRSASLRRSHASRHFKSTYWSARIGVAFTYTSIVIANQIDEHLEVELQTEKQVFQNNVDDKQQSGVLMDGCMYQLQFASYKGYTAYCLFNTSLNTSEQLISLAKKYRIFQLFRLLKVLGQN